MTSASYPWHPNVLHNLEAGLKSLVVDFLVLAISEPRLLFTSYERLIEAIARYMDFCIHAS